MKRLNSVVMVLGNNQITHYPKVYNLKAIINFKPEGRKGRKDCVKRNYVP